MTTQTVPGFLPSTSGFRFPNSFPSVPLRRMGIPGVLSVPIGDASNGLCGGMAFAARDYFESERPPPDDDAAPEEGPLFDYLVERLFDSFSLPWGPARYLELMNPALQDGETLLSRLGIGPHGRAWRMARDEWPLIREEIDSGHPSPLGLVTVRSVNPFDLKENHQILAFGYDLTDAQLTLRLYDPNRPGRDDLALSFELRDGGLVPTAMPDRGPVLSFFSVTYVPATPP